MGDRRDAAGERELLTGQPLAELTHALSHVVIVRETELGMDPKLFYLRPVEVQEVYAIVLASLAQQADGETEKLVNAYHSATVSTERTEGALMGIAGAIERESAARIALLAHVASLRSPPPTGEAAEEAARLISDFKDAVASHYSRVFDIPRVATEVNETRDALTAHVAALAARHREADHWKEVARRFEASADEWRLLEHERTTEIIQLEAEVVRLQAEREEIESAVRKHFCPDKGDTDEEPLYICIGESGDPIIEEEDIPSVIAAVSSLWQESSERYEAVHGRAVEGETRALKWAYDNPVQRQTMLPGFPFEHVDSYVTRYRAALKGATP